MREGRTSRAIRANQKCNREGAKDAKEDAKEGKEKKNR